MRLYFMGAIVFIMFICNMALAQSPPFSSITIFGETIDLYNKVSLFEKGSSKTPFKTEYISSSDGKYSIEVDIPDDMRRHDDYLYTDMRFWNDKNDNGKRDPGEPTSQCHFIIWIPSYNKLLFQVYKGPKYGIDSSNFRYDYKD